MKKVTTPTTASARPASATGSPPGRAKVPLQLPARATKSANAGKAGNGVEPTNGGARYDEPAGQYTALDAEQVLGALIGLKKGVFGTRLPLGWTGIAGKVADTFNEVAEMMSHSTDELSRISRLVGK